MVDDPPPHYRNKRRKKSVPPSLDGAPHREGGRVGKPPPPGVGTGTAAGDERQDDPQAGREADVQLPAGPEGRQMCVRRTVESWGCWTPSPEGLSLYSFRQRRVHETPSGTTIT